MRTLGHPNEANPMAPTVRLNPLEHIFPDWTNSVRALRFPWICLTISMISSCLDIGAGWDLLDFMMVKTIPVTTPSKTTTTRRMHRTSLVLRNLATFGWSGAVVDGGRDLFDGEYLSKEEP